MNVRAGVRFGPVVCRVSNIEDCRPAARLLCERMKHIPQVVFMDVAGNIHIAPGYEAIPNAAARWIIGTYNQGATIDNIASDLANEIRDRRAMYRGFP